MFGCLSFSVVTTSAHGAIVGVRIYRRRLAPDLALMVHLGRLARLSLLTRSPPACCFMFILVRISLLSCSCCSSVLVDTRHVCGNDGEQRCGGSGRGDARDWLVCRSVVPSWPLSANHGRLLSFSVKENTRITRAKQ